MRYHESISFGDLVSDTGTAPKAKAENSKVFGIKTRSKFRRFIFKVKSTESYSKKDGHLASILYPKVAPKNVKITPRAKNPSVNTSEVLVWCTCPAFHYWGSHFWATRNDFLMRGKEKENRFPKIRDPYGERALCKHLIKVHDKINRMSMGRLVKLFSQTSKTSSKDIEFVAFEDTLPIISEYLRGQKYSDMEITEILASLSYDNYVDVLTAHSVII